MADLKKPKKTEIPKLKPRPFRHAATTKTLLERLEERNAQAGSKKKKKKKKKK